ncbi:hypothetical protein ACHAPT_006282 [Fusarium lateritium]
MKRCTIACAGRVQVNRLGIESQKRWASWDKSALTKEALTQQVESGLGHDAEGNPLKIDTDSKTVSTASGSLPISPIMDPSWMKSKRRQKKAAPGPMTGQFRRQLANNPYAEALMTPMRRCVNSNTSLPRYFYQDFELVDHPDPNEPSSWWAPGPLTFENVTPFHDPNITELRARHRSGVREGEEFPQTPTEGSAASETANSETEPSSAGPNARQDTEAQERRPRRAPLTGYILARKKILELMGTPSQTHSMMAKMMSNRHGMAVASKGVRKIWREDMDEVLLQMMKSKVTDTLIQRGKHSTDPEFKFIQPCSGWDDSDAFMKGGCILWIPKEPQGESSAYATLDVRGPSSRTKLAVHDLLWVLGEEEVQRLKNEAKIFRDREILLLKPWRSRAIRNLHLLLWRLQGYLADPQVVERPGSEVETESEIKIKPTRAPRVKPKREPGFDW